jgi:hypothetical protein
MPKLNFGVARSLSSVRRKKRGGFLGIVAASIVQFRRAGIAMAGGLLHVFELSTVRDRSSRRWPIRDRSTPVSGRRGGGRGICNGP